MIISFTFALTFDEICVISDESIWTYYKDHSHMSMNQCPQEDNTDNWASFTLHIDDNNVKLFDKTTEKQRGNGKHNVIRTVVYSQFTGNHSRCVWFMGLCLTFL